MQGTELNGYLNIMSVSSYLYSTLQFLSRYTFFTTPLSYQNFRRRQAVSEFLLFIIFLETFLIY